MLCLHSVPFSYSDIYCLSAQSYDVLGLHTFVDCNPDVVRNIVLPDINDVVTRIRPPVILLIILSSVVEQIESGIGTYEVLSVTPPSTAW